MKIKLDAHGIMPERAHATDAGMDIKSPCDVYVPADGGCIIHTGVHVELPKDTAGMLVSKSGLNVKHGITTTGLIDEGYSGEIVVRMDNHGSTGYLVHKGDKITQLIVIPVYYEEIELVDSISGSERGNSGFRSSGR